MSDICFQTSGSSGAAKSILRTEESLQADAAALVKSFPEFWDTHPVIVSSVPPDHMYGALWRVRAPRHAGCRVAPDRGISAEALQEAHAQYGRFLFVTTPSFLEKLLAHPDASLLKEVFVGIVTSGSLLRKETALAAAEKFGTCPTEIFGSTETGTVAWRRRVNGDAWTVIDSVNVRLADDARLIVESPYAMTSPFVMSDAVELTAPRQFLLKGRTDRRVKILEQFVSLPLVEETFESHPWIERAAAVAYGEGVSRIGLLAVLTEAGRVRRLELSHTAFVAALRHDLLAQLGAAAFPRRISFVHALPVNTRGKTTGPDVANALSLGCQEPVVMSWTATATSLTASLVFPADLMCFDGHFPGFPVLPGVAQLYFLRHFARHVFADWPDAATYRRLKFQNIVRPGQAVTLSVNRRGDESFSFSLVSDKGPCSSGIVEGTH